MSLNKNLQDSKFHFIGIGGIGMSALARLLNARDIPVSGSDKEDSDFLNDLRSEGIKNIWTPHKKEELEKINPDYVVYSTAVLGTNEEVTWAKEKKKNILHRSELLEKLTDEKKLISVSGTHGKTTTSSMVSEILLSCNLNPSAILGGLLVSTNTNAMAGTGEYFVIEADESDKSFLKGTPEIAVITNIEADHLENYPGGIEEIKKSFLEFAKKAKNGRVCCFEDKITRDLISNNFDLKDENLITYGINGENFKLNARLNNSKSWDVFYNGKLLTSFKLQKPGEHNVLNALAAFGVGILLKLDANLIKASLEKYQGVKRRFQVLGIKENITFVDDYAHHPTEVRETIKAAKELNPNRLVIVFQPHQPTRLKDLWDEFKDVFKDLDSPTFITETYIARGSQIDGINSKKLVEEINNTNVKYLPGDLDQINSQLKDFIKPGDTVLIMGAGNITNLGPALLRAV